MPVLVHKNLIQSLAAKTVETRIAEDGKNIDERRPGAVEWRGSRAAGACNSYSQGEWSDNGEAEEERSRFLSTVSPRRASTVVKVSRSGRLGPGVHRMRYRGVALLLALLTRSW